MKPAPKHFDEDFERRQLYIKAMQRLQNRVTTQAEMTMWATRRTALEKHLVSKRTLWLNWVEANAEKIPWCGELVLEAVTLVVIGTDQ